MNVNTLFLRLEGPLQAWGDQRSKFVVRRTAAAPTKSGVVGLLCAALGVARHQAPHEWLSRLTRLRMGVRIDAAGVRWWDYHTVGAKMGIPKAEGGIKHTASTGEPETLVSRREYLCDASFLVALQGEAALIAELEAALLEPRWPPFLGRRSCPPSRPFLDHPCGRHFDTQSALLSIPWRPRLKGDPAPEFVTCLLDWEATPEKPEAPPEAEVWYDVPLTFAPPAHGPRFVVRRSIPVGSDDGVRIASKAAQSRTPRPPWPRADYGNNEYRRRRTDRLESDHWLCVFCKAPATTVQHVTYRRAGGDEAQEDLRSLCRLCHDAVTMIEYGLGMGLDRINPEDAQWRERILEKRREIIGFRSLETRRRRLAAEDVE